MGSYTARLLVGAVTLVTREYSLAQHINVLSTIVCTAHVALGKSYGVKQYSDLVLIRYDTLLNVQRCPQCTGTPRQQGQIYMYLPN